MTTMSIQCHTPYREDLVKAEQRTVLVVHCDLCGAGQEAPLYVDDPKEAWTIAQNRGWSYWPLVEKILCPRCTDKAKEAITEKVREWEREWAAQAGYVAQEEEG